MNIPVYLILAAAVPLAAAQDFDVLVYGATPSGIAAALNAGREGRTVALVEPTGLIGGLTAGGLSYTDFRTQEALTGAFREYMRRVERYYREKHGTDSQQVKDCFFGALAEPHVSRLVFEAMLRERREIRLFLDHELESVRVAGARESGVTVTSARFQAGGGTVELSARIFIDASYEGDLAALAGAPYRVGRESTSEYGERLAGLIYFQDGRILPGSTGAADKRVQSYNFRIIMTNRAENRVAVPMPEGYDRSAYLKLLEHLRSGRLKRIFSEDRSGILRLQKIPNDKSDMNDIKNAPIRLSLPGTNDDYPDGSREARQRVIARHRAYNQGLLFFLQNDPEVPAAIRSEAGAWGLPKDEFVETGHFPPRMYVREARRILGQYVFREQDTLMAAGSIRAPLHPDSIAMGDYVLNCHGEQEPGPIHPEVTEGDFVFPTQPFQVPYGVLVPRRVENLLVSVAVSATHVGFSALRLEPTWTALGQAAGLAAHLCLKHAVAPARVDVAELQTLLHERQASTIYFSDVPPGSKYYRAAQFFGTRGYFHHVVDPAQARYEALRPRFGLQYSYAVPLHAAELDRPLDDMLRNQWLESKPARCDPPQQGLSRGEFLAELYKCAPAAERERAGRIQ